MALTTTAEAKAALKANAELDISAELKPMPGGETKFVGSGC